MNDANGKPLSIFRELIARSQYWTVPLDSPVPLPESAVNVSKAEAEQDGGKDADSYKLNPVTPRA